MSTISLSFSLPLPLQESGRVNNLQVPPTPSNSMPLQAGVVTHCSLHWDIVWIPCCTTSKSLVPAHNSSEVEGSPQYSKRGSAWEDLVDFHQCHTLSHQKGLEEVALTSESPPTSPWDFGAYPISRQTRSSVCVCGCVLMVSKTVPITMDFALDKEAAIFWYQSDCTGDPPGEFEAGEISSPYSVGQVCWVIPMEFH